MAQAAGCVLGDGFLREASEVDTLPENRLWKNRRGRVVQDAANALRWGSWHRRGFKAPSSSRKRRLFASLFLCNPGQNTREIRDFRAIGAFIHNLSPPLLVLIGLYSIHQEESLRPRI